LNRPATFAPGPLAGMVKRKTTQLNMRIEPEIKAAAEKAAAADRRSLSSLIEILLIDYCKKRGLLTEEGRQIAKLLGVSRQTLYDILDEKHPVTLAMALRLGKLCANGSRRA
jgi:hypothetical protein